MPTLTSLPAALALLGPLLMLLVALLPSASGPAMARRANLAAWAGFATAVAAAAAFAATPATYVEQVALPLPFTQGLGEIAAYLDSVSLTMLLLVSFVGAIVTRYSANYLDGDPGQVRFMKWLCLTLAPVQLLMISGNLVMLAAAWIATSLCLHQLLVFYSDRPAALLAARKKFLVSRLGDACLIGACVLIYQSFGSVRFADIFAAAELAASSGAEPASLHWIAALLVMSALLKSAQFPFHGWLPEVMETPTPVSALLHAGIINAGGFLIVRMSPLVSLSAPSLDTLAIVGAFTALFAALVMLTQTSIKVSLAWSTVAQMGFMILQCGLGAYASAMLHIVTHSLYKAHSFLASGSVIDLAKAAWTPAAAGAPHPLWRAGALAASVLLVLGVGALFGLTPRDEPGILVLGAILLMGVTHLLWNSAGGRDSLRAVARAAGLAAAVCVAYFALQLGAHRLLASALPAPVPLGGVFATTLAVLVVLAFMLVLVLQSELPYRAATRHWRAAYVHLHNGLYLNALANRLVQRLWPARPAAAPRLVSDNPQGARP